MRASLDLQMLKRTALFAVPALAVTALALLFLADDKVDATQNSGSLQITGSETMRPLVTACAEAFMTRNPQADIIVRGGGSGDGISALLAGMADIGMTSRPFSDKEREFGVMRGIDVVMSELALDGIAVIVNSANPLTQLSLEELKSIFTGDVANWRDLGGSERPILVFARATGSGTAALFSERVLKGFADALGTQTRTTNEAIVAEVAARLDAIGYTSLGALRNADRRVRIVALSTEPDLPAFAPSAETLRAGTYPLGRALSFGMVGAASSTARAFIESCAGPAGQALIQRAGFVPVPASGR